MDTPHPFPPLPQALAMANTATPGAQRRNTRHPMLRALTPVALALLLAGCAAGPDYKRPEPPRLGHYTQGPLANETASAGATQFAAAQHLVASLPVSARWWQQLKSPRLDALIEKALEANPSLAAARASLVQARELQEASGARLQPQADLGLGAARQRISPSAQGLTGDAREFSLMNASVAVRYNLDLAGGNRRALEAMAARADYHRFELEAARLSLAATIATTAIGQARLAAQIEATDAILKAQDEQLQVGTARLRLGQATPDEIRALTIQTEQTRASLPGLRKQWQQSGHLLAVLAGQEPGTAELPGFTLADFSLPAELPLVVPAELVRHRPDIRAAEALLQAANADYGVAVSRLYPQINLSGSLGSQALTAGALFGGGSAVWSLVGQITQPLFNPALPAEKRAALAAFDAAAAHYQEVVLAALRNVADTLRAVESDAHSLAALAVADAAARESLVSVGRQYELGAASYLQLLIARQQAQQSALALAAAQAQRLADSVALYQAMGSSPD